jgi:hypothetical protein
MKAWICIQVAQGIVHWQGRVNTIMSIEGPQRQRQSLYRLRCISLPKNLLRGVFILIQVQKY